MFDSNKVYLSLDLAAKYRVVHDLRVGHEVLPLYPDRAPAHAGVTESEGYFAFCEMIASVFWTAAAAWS